MFELHSATLNAMLPLGVLTFKQMLLAGGSVIIVILMLLFLGVFASVASLWFRAYMSGAGIGPLQMVVMKLKKVNPQLIVDTRIMLVQAGLDDITTIALESHYLAGGNVPLVIRALIAAHRAQIPLDWKTASAIDLAGRNVLEAVQTSVKTKVIDCPDPSRSGRPTLDGVARDGIQLKAKARVTVRTNIKQLIGGATEETIIARVGEGIVSAIGSCASHKEVLANPMLIARAVLAKGLDSQTAYEIVSIDIADIDIGDNVGARLQADQAEADMRIARAHAEERRAAAVALEQEMRALTQENQAEVVLSESAIPKAMAEAYRQGALRATPKT
ncbi:MAG: flotillin-like protein FloA [Planctomycetales bacterium]|nr:flotillin-like protein FloA [Planctomycetales bacterium]